LKRWLNLAEEEDLVDELKSLVALCKKLPFDGKSVKESEIGKTIKKLLKYKSVTNNVDGVASLREEITNRMKHWTTQVGTKFPTTAAAAVVDLSSALGSAINTSTNLIKSQTAGDDDESLLDKKNDCTTISMKNEKISKDYNGIAKSVIIDVENNES